MWIFVAPVLFILIILFVAFPFLSNLQEQRQRQQTLTQRQRAVRRKDEVFSVLKDIEMDYHMGKLSEADYLHLKAEFEEEAVEAFGDLDRLKKDVKKAG